MKHAFNTCAGVLDLLRLNYECIILLSLHRPYITIEPVCQWLFFEIKHSPAMIILLLFCNAKLKPSLRPSISIHPSFQRIHHNSSKRYPISLYYVQYLKPQSIQYVYTILFTSTFHNYKPTKAVSLYDKIKLGTQV